MKTLRDSIVWALIIGISLPVPALQVAASAESGNDSSFTEGSKARAQSQGNSAEFLAEVFSQHLMLVKGPATRIGRPSEQGFFRRKLPTFSRWIDRLEEIARNRREASKTEVRVDYDRRPSDLVDAFGINVKSKDELSVSTYAGSDGKQKLRITYNSNQSPFDGTRLEIDPPAFDIVSFVEHENIIALKNRDGFIIAIDRANLQRQFGRGYILYSRIWRVPPEEGTEESLRFNSDPFSLRDLEFSAAIPRDSRFKVPTGSLLVVRKKEGSNPQIVDIITPKSILMAMTLPLVAVALAVDNEKLGVKVSLGQLQRQFDEYLASRPDFFDAAKAQGVIEKIRSIEADSITGSVASVIRQLKDSASSQSLTIDGVLRAQNLELSPAAREVLTSVFSPEGNRSSGVLQAAVLEFASEVDSQLSGTGLNDAERAQLMPLHEVLSDEGLIGEKINQIRSVFVAGPISFEDWTSREGNRLNETARDVLGLALLSAQYDVWEPGDRIVVAALYELKGRLDHFLKENGNHPQKPSLEKLRDSLDGIKSAGTQNQVSALVSKLRGLADELPENSLLDLVAAASVDGDSSLKSSLDEAVLVHPKHMPFLTRVKNSSFMKALKVVQSQVLTYPALTMVFSFSYLYLAKPFTDAYRPELAKAWAYQFGWLYLVTFAFAAVGRTVYKREGSYAMGKIGMWFYGQVMSYPPLAGLARALGFENFAFAALHGVFPTPWNGGLAHGDQAVEEGRETVVAEVRERDARRSYCRDLAFRLVAESQGVSLNSQNWTMMQAEWRGIWIKKFKSYDEKLEAAQREALLSADPNQIADADAAIRLARFTRETEFLGLQGRQIAMTDIVANRLDEKFKGNAFSRGLGADLASEMRTVAGGIVRELGQISNVNLRLQSVLTWARAGVRYDSPKLLAVPITIYRATQKAVIRPTVAKMVQSNWQADVAIQFLLDGAWNGYPIAGPIRTHFGVELPTRANMENPDQLFAQPGETMNTHRDENANLRQQDAVYTASAMTKYQTEMPGAGIKIPNPFNFSEVPDCERFQAFSASARLWMRFAFQPREIGVQAYIEQANLNNYRYALPKFYMQLITSGLIAHHSLTKIIGQTIFLSGLGLWGFGLPWLPLNLGINAVENHLAEKREEFLGSRGRFLAAVINRDEVAAKQELLTLKVAFESAQQNVEGLTDLGAKTLHDIGLSDLERLATTLERIPAPTPAEVNKFWSGTTSFTGAVTTTALGVPFFVFMMACPLPWWGQSLAGVGGLMLYPISIEAMRIYNDLMRKHYDPRKIQRDGEAEAKRLSDPRNYALEVSSRLSEVEAVERERVISSGGTSTEREARLQEIGRRFSEARRLVVEKARQLGPCPTTIANLKGKTSK